MAHHKIRLSTALLIALITLIAGSAPAIDIPATDTAAPHTPAHAPGQILVCLAKGQDGACLTDLRAPSALTSALVEHGLTRARPIGTRRAGRFFVLESARSDLDVVRAARDLMATPEVSSAAPNYYRDLLLQPNDPYLDTQWYLQPGNTAGVALDEAWDLETGSPATVIAIIDTGVDVLHPDLADNMWTNPGEVPDNGLDDDGNGYADDIHGWDFGQGDADPMPQRMPDAMGLDVAFHGTHCAGIASATTDNNLGVAGAGWNCSLMALKLPDEDGNMTDLAITGAVLYAVAAGADVISMSFGAPDQDGLAAYMQDLMDEALDAGVVCVAAAGNDNSDTLFYPAACEGVIAVGATDETGGRASFSSYGTWVDVAAPGNRIWSTICRNYEFSVTDRLLYMLAMGWDGVNPYMFSDGTSMACPLVAGICGLIRNQSPGLSPAEVRQRLIDTGDAVAFDQPLGVKVNAARALESTSAASLPGAGSMLVVGHPNPFNPSTTIQLDIPRSGLACVTVHDAAGRLVRTLLREEVGPGPRALVFDGRDDSGRHLASGTYFVRVAQRGVTAGTKLQLIK
ncbi:hypothetical protein CSB20_10795 [bacterium DOLZORAL124_64_63]|nr:MAG: hypothetical protein CSB20_10795 [bacterium DOLZORAL124_64_63]